MHNLCLLAEKKQHYFSPVIIATFPAKELISIVSIVSLKSPICTYVHRIHQGFGAGAGPVS